MMKMPEGKLSLADRNTAIWQKNVIVLERWESVTILSGYIGVLSKKINRKKVKL